MFQFLVCWTPSWGRITYFFSGKVLKVPEGEFLSPTNHDQLGNKELRDIYCDQESHFFSQGPAQLPMGSVTWQGPSSCCCTALQPLRGSRAQLSSGHHNSSHRQEAKLQQDGLYRATLWRGYSSLFYAPNQLRPFFQKQDSQYDGILNNGGRNFRSSYEGFQC